MKKLFLTLSGLFASVPGLIVIFGGIGTPPGYSALFGGIIEALGSVSFLILWINKDKIRSAPSAKITRAAVLLCAGFILSIGLYLVLYNFCVVGNPVRHYVYYPLWTSGDIAEMIDSAGGRSQALEEYGFAAVYRAVKGMPSYPIALATTTFVLILLYQAIFTTLCLTFGLLGFRGLESLPTAMSGNGEGERPVGGQDERTSSRQVTALSPSAVEGMSTRSVSGAEGTPVVVSRPETPSGAEAAVRRTGETGLGEAKEPLGGREERTQEDSHAEFTVFISYAHKDNESSDPSKRWLDRLLEYLHPLVLQKQVSARSDLDIETGALWHESIQAQIRTAKVAVLLISPAFLASKYIRNSELPALLMSAKQKGVTILPIILRHSLFAETMFKYPDPLSGPHEASLSIFQAANSPSRPLNAMDEHEQDQVLLSIAQLILKIALPGHEGGRLT